MIKTKRKTGKWIDEKPLNPVKTEEENRFKLLFFLGFLDRAVR